jgi:dihydrofolate reductase
MNTKKEVYMNLIVAVDKNYGIGKNGGLLTHLPDDLKNFKALTLNKILIMGRKTLESLPGAKLLPDRETWILSRNPDYVKEGALVFESMDAIWKHMKDNRIDSNQVFVAGGAFIYQAFLPYIDKAYVTKIDYDFKADICIDNLDELPYLCLESVSEVHTHKEYSFRFTTYRKC